MTERTTTDPARLGRPRAQRLVIGACAALMVYVALFYVTTLAGLPRYFQRVTGGAVPTVIMGSDSDVSNAILAEAAASRGQSLAAYAVYNLALKAVLAAGFWAAAALVLWGHGGEWFRWLTALLLFFFPTGAFYAVAIIAFPEAETFLGASFMLWSLLLLFLFLFPDGQAPAKWMRWPMAVLVAGDVLYQVLGFVALLGQPLPAAWQAVGEGLLLAEFVFVVVAQVYRFVRVAGPVERKQIQWFVAALAFVALTSPLSGLLAGGDTSIAQAYWNDLEILTALILPAAITIGILRYRLWDIDVIIRRTLIYSALTAVLALAYFGSVLLLEGGLRLLTGQGQSTLVVVVSTLAIAALFVPVRRRVQAAIDRRFYRRKYDAVRTLAGFAAGARDETDLEQLSTRLMDVVDETMQPETVDLWLRPARERERPLSGLAAEKP